MHKPFPLREYTRKSVQRILSQECKNLLRKFAYPIDYTTDNELKIQNVGWIIALPIVLTLCGRELTALKA